MKVTLKLTPAVSEATAPPDPGVTPAAQELVGQTVSAEGWTPVTLPQMLPFFKDNDGEAVFRKEIIIPENEAGKDMILSLGVLDDFDNTYFNGVEVGRTDIKTATWWLTPRNYVVPGKLVRAGRNVIAVRLFDRFGSGGFEGNGGLPMSKPEGDQPGHQSTGPRVGWPMSLRPKPEGTSLSGIITPIIAPISLWEIIPTAITGGRRVFFGSHYSNYAGGNPVVRKMRAALTRAGVLGLRFVGLSETETQTDISLQHTDLTGC
jgi:hypothetical protein